MTDLERFNTKYKVNTNGCWDWIAAQNGNGYGQFYFCHGGKCSRSAHRFSYIHYIGEIPEKFSIDHICRNRLCVNPEHLEAVTNKENVLRGNGLTAINARKTHCMRNHELSGHNLIIQVWKGDTRRNCRKCKQMEQKIRRAKERKETKAILDSHINKLSTE